MAPFGMHFCAGLGQLPGIMQLRAKHAQRVFEQLTEVVIGGDANLLVHAFFSMAAMSLYAKFLKFARHNLLKACIALNAANLRFIPTTGYPSGLTEEAHERIVILSQVVYLENYMFLVVDGIKPEMAARIEKEFRHELQVTVTFQPFVTRTDGWHRELTRTCLRSVRWSCGHRESCWSRMQR